jgi:hypothetical protein
VAAGVAAVAVVALQQRAVAPTLRAGPAAAPMTAQNTIPAQGPAGLPQTPREAMSYTVPPTSPASPVGMPQARLTNYVLAHSRYSSGLDLRGVLADLLIEADEPQPAVNQAAAHVAP